MADGHRLPPVEIRDAQIIFRNFSGKPTRFQKEGGRRNFCVLLDDETAKMLEDSQWRVKYLKPREEGDAPQPYLQVKVNYTGFRPPTIDVIAGSKLQHITEDTVDMLDSVDITKCDMVLNPSWFEMPDGTCGYTAYLNELYVTIALSRLAEEYARLEEELEDKYVDCGHVCNGDCATCPENV